MPKRSGTGCTNQFIKVGDAVVTCSDGALSVGFEAGPGNMVGVEVRDARTQAV